MGSAKTSALLPVLRMVLLSAADCCCCRLAICCSSAASWRGPGERWLWAKRMSLDFGTNRLLFHSQAWVT